MDELIAGLAALRQAQREERARTHPASDARHKPRSGRPPLFPFPDRVVATVLHLRLSLPEEILAHLFGTSRSTIRRALAEIRDLLDQHGHRIEPVTAPPGLPARITPYVPRTDGNLRARSKKRVNYLRSLSRSEDFSPPEFDLGLCAKSDEYALNCCVRAATHISKLGDTMSTHTRPPVPPVQEPPTSPPPKRPWWRRHKVTAGILTMVVLIAAVATISIIAGGTNVSNTPSSPATTPPAAAQPSTPSATTPSEAATPTPTHPAPPTVTYTGVGAKVLKINKTTGPMAVSITHRGSSNFAVTSLDASGGQIDLLVNTIGNYSGTRLIDVMQGQQTAALKIEADGSWSVTLKRVSQMPMWDGTGTWTGKGDTVVLIKSGAFAGLDSVKITNTGESNFVVMAYGDTQDLLVNEIGNYSGEQLMPSGTALLEIQSDGTWSLHKV